MTITYIQITVDTHYPVSGIQYLFLINPFKTENMVHSNCTSKSLVICKQSIKQANILSLHHIYMQTCSDRYNKFGRKSVHPRKMIAAS